MVEIESSLVKWLKPFFVIGSFPYKWTKSNLEFNYLCNFPAAALCCLATFSQFSGTPLCFFHKSVYCFLQNSLSVITNLVVASNIIIFITRRKKVIASLMAIMDIHYCLRIGPITVPITLKIITVTTFLEVSAAISYQIISAKSLMVVWHLFALYKTGIILAFVTLNQISGQCLSKMNEMLRSKLTDKLEHSIGWLVPMYAQLVDEVNIMNGFFSIQILLIVAYDIGLNVFMAFQLITFKGEKVATLKDFIYFGQAFFPIFGFFALFGFCESIMKRAKTFSKLLANLALQSDGEQLEKNPYIMMHFIIRKKLKFTTYGGITLNYRFMLSLIASCITYFVIFLQFNNQ